MFSFQVIAKMLGGGMLLLPVIVGLTLSAALNRRFAKLYSCSVVMILFAVLLNAEVYIVFESNVEFLYFFSSLIFMATSIFATLAFSFGFMFVFFPDFSMIANKQSKECNAYRAYSKYILLFFVFSSWIFVVMGVLPKRPINAKTTFLLLQFACPFNVFWMLAYTLCFLIAKPRGALPMKVSPLMQISKRKAILLCIGWVIYLLVSLFFEHTFRQDYTLFLYSFGITTIFLFALMWLLTPDRNAHDGLKTVRIGGSWSDYRLQNIAFFTSFLFIVTGYYLSYC